MARSGEFFRRFHPNGYGTENDWDDSGYYLTIEWSQSDPFSEKAIRTNTTTLSATLWIGSKGNGYVTSGQGEKSCGIVVETDSQTFRQSGTIRPNISTTNNRYAVEVISGSWDIIHESDGTAEFKIRGYTGLKTNSFSGTGYLPGTTSSNFKPFVLDTIPKPSTISILNSTPIEIGDTLHFKIKSNLSSLTHTLLYSFDKATWHTIGQNIATTYSWDLTENLAKNFPNTSSALIYFRVETYYGTQKIGSNQLSTILSLKEEVGKPFLSNLQITHANPKIDKNDTTLDEYFILNKSQVSAFVNACPYGGATIKYFIYNINGVSYNISPSGDNLTDGLYSFVLKNNLGSIAQDFLLKISIQAIDSRGFYSNIVQSEEISVLNYFSPSIKNIKIIRGRVINGQFEEYPTGERVKFNFSYNIEPLSIEENGEKKDLNKKKILLKYSVDQGPMSEPEEREPSDFRSNIDTGYDFLSDSLIIKKDLQYKINLTVQDSFTSSTEILNIRSKGTLLNFGADGLSAAVGGKATGNSFTIFYPTLFQQGIKYRELITDGSELSVDLNELLTSGWYSFIGTPAEEEYHFPIIKSETNSLKLIDQGTIEVSSVTNSQTGWITQKVTYLSTDKKVISFSRSYSNLFTEATWSDWIREDGIDENSEIDYSRITAIESENGAIMMTNDSGTFDLKNMDGYLDSYIKDTSNTELDTRFKSYLDSVFKSYVLNTIYPVGSLYLSTSSTSPATLFGGNWTRIQDRFLLAAGSNYQAGKESASGTGTSATVNIPKHKHLTPLITGDGAFGFWTRGDKESVTSTNRVGAAYNSFSSEKKYTTYYTYEDGACSTDVDIKPTIPPYLSIYVWKRTA